MSMLKYIVLFLGLHIMIIGCANIHKDLIIVDESALGNEFQHRLLISEIDQNKPIHIQKHFVITGHRITKGNGSVIAYRYFNKGLPFYTDQGTYEKLTIYIPSQKIQPGAEIDLSDKSIIAFWSDGSSHFPGKSGCFGYAAKGILRIKSVSNEQVFAEIDAIFKLFSPGGWEKDCGVYKFSRKVKFKRKSVSSLTPWEGAIGKHIYDESMFIDKTTN